MSRRSMGTTIALIVALWVGFGPSDLLAESKLKGRLGIQWHTLTRTNSASADYQALRGYARLSTDEIGPLGMRLHLDARGKKGLDEHLQTLNRPFENRAQIQQVYLEAKGPGQARLFIGRHHTPLRGISSQSVDGLSIQRESQQWSARISGGFQVAFWRPNTPIDADARQWGGEVEWHPTALPLRLQTAVLGDVDSVGRSRTRLGLGGTLRACASLNSHFAIEIDPRENRVWASRIHGAYRLGRQSRLHASYSQRLASSYPVFSAQDTLLNQGKMHALSFSAATRRGLWSTRLHTRLSFGARELGSERLHIIWHRLPHTILRLNLNAQDSWSPWRRIEQASLALSGTWPKRLYFSLGVKQSLFKWNTSRQPKWRARTRPHIVLRYTAPAGWSVHMRIEEIIDEFAHLRTRATTGLSYRL